MKLFGKYFVFEVRVFIKVLDGNHIKVRQEKVKNIKKAFSFEFNSICAKELTKATHKIYSVA